MGIFLFPSLIYMAYGAMYPALPDLIYSVPWLYPFLAIIAAILCTSFVSILVLLQFTSCTAGYFNASKGSKTWQTYPSGTR